MQVAEAAHRQTEPTSRSKPTHTSSVRVLLVDDDDGVCQVVASGLGEDHFAVDRASTVGQALRLLNTRSYDALVLDLLLPDGSGLTVARALRSAGSDLPIIMLTARDSVDQRVEGLTHGADDYLCKPFAVQELAARIRAVLRRARTTHLLCFSDMKLDLITRVAKRKDIKVELSSRESDLLAYFMRHPDKVLEREQILEDVWGGEADDGSNVLNVYVNYLRNKMEKGIYPRLIHTVRGAGYILSDAPPEDLGI